MSRSRGQVPLTRMFTFDSDLKKHPSSKSDHPTVLPGHSIVPGVAGGISQLGIRDVPQPVCDSWATSWASTMPHAPAAVMAFTCTT